MYGQIFGGAKAMDRPQYSKGFNFGVAQGAERAYDLLLRNQEPLMENNLDGAYNRLSLDYGFVPRGLRYKKGEDEFKGQGNIIGGARLTPEQKMARQSELTRKRLNRADKKNFRGRVKENRKGLQDFLKADSLAYKQKKADARTRYKAIQAEEDEVYGERAGERYGVSTIKKAFSQGVKAMLNSINELVAQFKINKLAPRTKVATLVAAIHHPFTAEVRKGARKLVSEGYTFPEALDMATNDLRRDVHENLADIKAHPEVQASLDEIVDRLVSEETEDYV